MADQMDFDLDEDFDFTSFIDWPPEDETWTGEDG